MGIQKLGDGLARVYGMDVNGDVFRDIHLSVPRSACYLLPAVGGVGDEHGVQRALFIGGIEMLDSLCEQSECGHCEYPPGALPLAVFRHVQHGGAGTDHIVHNEHILVLHAGADVFMYVHHVIAAHHLGPGPALVEDAHIQPKLVGVFIIPRRRA